MVCSACGQERPEGDRYCGLCGTPLPHRPMSTPGAQSTFHLSRGTLDASGRSAPSQIADRQQSHGDEWSAELLAAEILPSPARAAHGVADPPGETFDLDRVLPEMPRGESGHPSFPPQDSEPYADGLPSNLVEDLRLPDFNRPEAVAVETPASRSEVSDFLDGLVTESAEPSTTEPPHFPWMDGVLDQIEFEVAKTANTADERPRFMDVLGDLPPLEPDTSVPSVLTPEPIVASASVPETRTVVPESRTVPRKITPSTAPQRRTPLSRKQLGWLAAAAALVLVVLGAIQWRAPLTRTSQHLAEVVTAKIDDLMGPRSGPPPTPAASSEPNAFSKAVGFDEQPKPQTENPPAGANTSATAPGENPKGAATAAPPTVTPPVQAPPPAAQSQQTAAAKQTVPAETSATADKTLATPKTTEVAKLWKATATGNPNAPLQLAEMYVKGDGVPRSCEQAVVLLKTAALRENAEACNRLATMYADASCVQRDRVEAYRWVRAALTVNPGSLSARQNRDRIWEGMTPEERMQTQRTP
ncbi:MAG: hypothetical protein ACLPND_03870 [Candidatus Korobacteraceae bacterium]